MQKNKSRQSINAHRQFKAIGLDIEMLSVVPGEGAWQGITVAVKGVLCPYDTPLKDLNSIFFLFAFYRKSKCPF